MSRMVRMFGCLLPPWTDQYLSQVRYQQTSADSFSVRSSNSLSVNCNAKGDTHVFTNISHFTCKSPIFSWSHCDLRAEHSGQSSLSFWVILECRLSRGYPPHPAPPSQEEWVRSMQDEVVQAWLMSTGGRTRPPSVFSSKATISRDGALASWNNLILLITRGHKSIET